MTVFNDHYSASYDSFYAGKDYRNESKFVCDQFAKYGLQSLDKKFILDLGCGTGGHLLPLLEKGASVCGVDLSGAMLNHAQSKLTKNQIDSGRYSLLNSSVSDFKSAQTFDAAIMMFAVLGYLGSNQQIINSLKNVKSHLKPDGLFFCDFWYGPAVLSEKPSDRVKIFNIDGRKIVRAVNTSLDVNQSRADVKIELLTVEPDKSLKESVEVHSMRYFFESELNTLFEVAGFEVLKFGDFLNSEAQPTINSWNAFLVARVKE